MSDKKIQDIAAAELFRTDEKFHKSSFVLYIVNSRSAAHGNQLVIVANDKLNILLFSKDILWYAVVGCIMFVCLHYICCEKDINIDVFIEVAFAASPPQKSIVKSSAE